MSRQRPHGPDCGCFGCHVGSLAVATKKIRHGADPVERVPVIREVGPLAGTVGGFHTKHWDGRQDATVTPPPVRLKTRIHHEPED